MRLLYFQASWSINTHSMHRECPLPEISLNNYNNKVKNVMAKDTKRAEDFKTFFKKTHNMIPGIAQ